MDAKNILIFTALHNESRAILKVLRGSACRVQAVGIGAGHLPSRSEIAGVSVIVMCGLAGGLDPTLGIGDIVLDGPSDLIPPSIAYRRGRIYTAASIASNPQQKARLFQQTQALAVDMEQAIVRDYAKPFGIPMIGIRAISDTANQILHPAVLQLVDDKGRPRPARIAMTLIRRPNLIPYLRTLGKNTNIALSELGNAVRSIVENLQGK